MNLRYMPPADSDAFLASLQPTVARIAKRYYYATLHMSIDLADLEQEGMIGAWQALATIDDTRLPGEIYSYCLRAAQMAISFFLRRENRKPCCSLEMYVSNDAEEIRNDREIVAPADNHTSSSLALRRSTLRLLRRYLNNQQQAVLMADFQIDQPRQGHAETPEAVMSRLSLSQSAWDACKYRALRRLKRELASSAERQVQA